MTWLLVLRHAQSSWNAEGRWQGWADPPLSAEGDRQARAAGAVLRSLPLPVRVPAIDGVVASDLQRARQTAAILARGLGIEAPVEVVADLKERDVGAWTGRTMAEIEEGWPGKLAEWRAGTLPTPPDGESREDFERRLRRGLAYVADSWAGRCVLAVTHGGALRVIERMLDAEPRPVVNLAGFWLSADRETGFAVGPAVALADEAGGLSGEAAS